MTPPDLFAQGNAYERFMGRWSRRLAPQLVEFASVAGQDAVLDVGCGTGALTFFLAETFPSVSITGVDPSGSYVREAQMRMTGSRARFLVGDAQNIELPDASFDKTLSLLVLSFVPDRARAVREMSRVTRAGGIVSAAVWDYGEGMEMLRVFWDEAVAADPSAAARDERHLPLCRRGELAALWRACGLDDVEERTLTIEMAFSAFDDYWQPFLGGQGPAGAYAVSLAGAPRAALETRLRRRLLAGRDDGPVVLRARAWAVKGRRP